MNILVTGGNGQLGCSLRKVAGMYPQHRFVFTDVPEADITDYKTATEEIRKELKEGRKISDARLKSLKEVSHSMKESARMIDAVISEAGGKKQAVSRRTPGNRKAGTIEITF